MATLNALRAKLNGEIGVDTDAEPKPWTMAVREQAISDGYADLWRVGVWKFVKQDISTASLSQSYAVSAIRKLERIEVLDTQGRLGEYPAGFIEDDGSGGWQLYLKGATLATGATLRVRGWAPYKSVFSSGTDTDDIPAEHNRIPLLKAKSILWRIQLARFARYGARQALPPENNMSIDQLIGMIAAAEKEYEVSASALAGMRRRSSKPKNLGN